MNILIIRSSELSSWGSCRVISPNLQKCYQALESSFKISWFNLPADYLKTEIEENHSYLLELAGKLQHEHFDRLVFIDHLPNPAEILNNLSNVIELDRLPPIIIHLYGDFTYFSKEWLSLSGKLTNHPVKFLVASKAQEKFLNHFCLDSNSTQKYFFPVDSTEHAFNPEERMNFRAKHGIGAEDIVILYSGRVSLQKNVDVLIREYLKLLKNNDHAIHLWIAGAFDDMGAPFMGVETKEGYLYSKIEQYLSRHPKEFINKIKFFGMKNKQELRAIHSAADMFISLSLYHDEDYGMSPAEALASGLPALLTDWGGYSSFINTDWRAELLAVAISEYGLQIKTSKIKEFFNDYLDSYIKDSDRQRWSEAFLNHFGIQKGTKELDSILKMPVHRFAGFNWQLAPFSDLYAKSSEVKSPNPNASPSDKNFYFQAYQHYISAPWSENQSDAVETIQWMYDHVKSADNDIVTERRKNDRSYHHALFPFSKKYFGAHNPTLLFDGRIAHKLTAQKKWTLRDGLVPLCLFFKEQSPEVFTGEIAVDSDFSFLVPPKWQEKTSFFEIYTENLFHREHLPEKVFISGMLNSTLADPAEFQESLNELQERLGVSALEKMDIIALIPNKKKELWGKWDESDLLKISSALYKLSPHIKFTTWSKLKHESSFKNCLYYEINQKYFISDSFLKHFALSRGAGLLLNDQKLQHLPGEKINLSLYHGLKVVKPEMVNSEAYKNPFDDDYFQFFKTLYLNNTKNPQVQTSWDSWFAYYLKKYYRMKRHKPS